jgi:hypothetical protein
MVMVMMHAITVFMLHRHTMTRSRFLCIRTSSRQDGRQQGRYQSQSRRNGEHTPHVMKPKYTCICVSKSMRSF